MRDLKNLSQKKRSIDSFLSGKARGNRRIAPSRIFSFWTIFRGFLDCFLVVIKFCVYFLSFFKVKFLALVARLRLLPAPAILFLLIAIAFTPLCFFAASKVHEFAKETTAWIHKFNAPSPRAAEAAKHSATSQFEIACALLNSADFSDDYLTVRTPSELTVQYTIQSDLQKRVYDFMASNKVPYGVFIAVEPTTGRILAMTSYSQNSSSWKRRAFFDPYPMASLFKIVTASAALENNLITPETVVEFRGGFASENPRYWLAAPRGKNNKLDITDAMGKSVNPVFGRVAADIAGKAHVMKAVGRFGFNRAIMPDIPVKKSKATEPQDVFKLMQMGAGLDREVKISPLHAVMLMSAIANEGRMMRPELTDKIIKPDGTVWQVYAPQEALRMVSPETALSLTRMLSSTVTTGTSRKAFHDQQGRLRLNVDVCAKTGSINGTDPQGHYSWFAAFAPAQNPQIALVALVINGDRWKIKSSQVGALALEEFFERQEQRISGGREARVTYQ